MSALWMIKVSHTLLKRTSEEDVHLYITTLMGVYECLLIRVRQDLLSEHDCKESVTQHFGDVGLGCLSCRMKKHSFLTQFSFLLSVVASCLALSFCYVWAFSFCFSAPQGPYS